MKTQNQIVLEQLKTKGFISNLYAIKHYILRLGARISDLRSDGYDITGAYEVKKGKKTKNFIYTLVR